MHPDPNRNVFGPKTLLYFEENMASFVISYGAFPLLLPRPNSNLDVQEILSRVDGLILQAGSDLSPHSYQEEALKEEWQGDAIRDQYEIELLHQAMAMDKPVLGICRGMQMINVALGGSLYQDIPSQVKQTTIITHRDGKLYDKLNHEITLQPNTRTAKLYTHIPQRKIISVHHQAVKDLGKELSIEAVSKEDGIIEAIRYSPANSNNQEPIPYVFGTQWHPEYQDPNDTSLMSIRPIMDDFLQEIAKRKKDA